MRGVRGALRADAGAGEVRETRANVPRVQGCWQEGARRARGRKADRVQSVREGVPAIAEEPDALPGVHSGEAEVRMEAAERSRSMTEWKDPQQRAEDEDRARALEAEYAGEVDVEQADAREGSGKAVIVDGEQVFPPKVLESMADSSAEADSLGNLIADEIDASKLETVPVYDTREQLEADVHNFYTHTVSTAMWPPSANKKTDMLCALPVDTVIGWLDRQAAITERECIDQRIADQIGSIWKGEEVRRLQAERDALQEKVDEFELRERCAHDYDYRQAAEMWEQAFEDKCAELHLMAEERERLFDAKHKVQAERYYWKQQVQRIVDAAYPASHSPEPAYAPEVMNYPPSQKHTDPATMVGAVIDGLRDERSEQYMAILKENEQVQAELDHARSCPDCGCCGWTEKVAELTAERDRLLEQLNRVWLKDADGKPLHIGETRYGQDGTGWPGRCSRWLDG